MSIGGTVAALAGRWRGFCTPFISDPYTRARLEGYDQARRVYEAELHRVLQGLPKCIEEITGYLPQISLSKAWGPNELPMNTSSHEIPPIGFKVILNYPIYTLRKKE